MSEILLQAPVAEANQLDIRGWLDRPGVKLLAVEFYATWCKPCMEAVPRWKKLHEKYRKQGLRLLVVATQDPDGGCANPGWNPDAVICDDDGHWAKMFAAERLPAAFLWSWQGQLLVRNGHVDEVERGIQAWVRELPRVEVALPKVEETTAGIGQSELQALVLNELGRSAKVSIVASDSERERLRQARRNSLKAQYDEQAACELGKQLPPNALLDVSILGQSARQRLRLAVLSLTQGCLIASAVVNWNPAQSELAVAEATTELLYKLRPSIQMPKGAAILTERASFLGGRSTSSYPPSPMGGGPPVEARFVSQPPGAVVLLDGSLLCQDTSKGCQRRVASGIHTVTMQKERYRPRSEQVVIREGTHLSWPLEPSFATLSVSSRPSNMELFVDGQMVGATPLTSLEVSPGSHVLSFDARCYNSQSQSIRVNEGEFRAVDFVIKPIIGVADITAFDLQNRPQSGTIFVDGKRIGSLPGVYKVPICSKNLEIKQNGRLVYRTRLTLSKGRLSHVRAVLTNNPSFTEPPQSTSTNSLATEDVISSSTPSKLTGQKIMMLRDANLQDYREANSESESYNVSRTISSLGAEVLPIEASAMSRVYRERIEIKAMVIPELVNGTVKEMARAFSRRARKYLRAYVAKGGTLIMFLDSPGQSRAVWLLRAMFKWRLKFLDATGAGRLNAANAQSLSLSALPSILANNSDTDVVAKESLPRHAKMVYEDQDGHSMVSVIPVGRGRVILMGWDWFDAQPEGKYDGGWVSLLASLLGS